MYRKVVKVYHMINFPKFVTWQGPQSFPSFGINVSFYTDVSESLLCHNPETLDGVRSLPLEDGTFCQPGITRTTISSTLCQISVFKIGLKCRWRSNHVLCQPPSCCLSCVEIMNIYLAINGVMKYSELI